MDRERDIFWIWFSSFPFLRLRTRMELLSSFNGPEGVFSAGEAMLRKIRGISDEYAVVLSRAGFERADSIIGACEKQNIDIISIDDPRYPFRLKNIYAPPSVLYVKGKIPDLDKHAVISVIGTRKASQYGLRMGKRIAYEIVRCGAYAVSLLTPGVDRAVAEGALLAGDRCIGVLGTSHEQEHSSLADEIVEKGALISEYPPGSLQNRSFFRDRNRVAAGISLGAVVVEAPEKSGTRYFVNEALDQGKDVFAVPGNADSDNSIGTLELMKMGARPVASGWDVLSEYTAAFPELHFSSDRLEDALSLRVVSEKPVSDSSGKTNTGSGSPSASEWKRKTANLTDDQSVLVGLIRKGVSVIDDLIEKSGLPANKVLSSMTILEIKGIIVRDMSGKIELNKHFDE